MKNTMSFQINKNSLNLNRSCIITYQGKEVNMTRTKEQSFEKLFGEIFHGLVRFLVKINSFLERNKFRKGYSKMRNKNIIKHEEEDKKLCAQCYDCFDSGAYWQSFSIQKEMH